MIGIAASPLAALLAIASLAPSDDAELLGLEAELAANNVEHNRIDDERVLANKAGLPDEHLRAAMRRLDDRDVEIDRTMVQTLALHRELPSSCAWP